MAVEVAAGTVFQAGTPKALFQHFLRRCQFNTEHAIGLSGMLQQTAIGFYCRRQSWKARPHHSMSFSTGHPWLKK